MLLHSFQYIEGEKEESHDADNDNNDDSEDDADDDGDDGDDDEASDNELVAIQISSLKMVDEVCGYYLCITNIRSDFFFMMILL
jgi:hypothetical protein